MPRATALVKNFGGQWLFLRNMKAVDPDANAFPDFDDNLREAFLRETELFLESQMREDRPLAGAADGELHVRRTSVWRGSTGSGTCTGRISAGSRPIPAAPGLLGHGSILTVTSYATRTSPVLRGK